MDRHPVEAEVLDLGDDAADLENLEGLDHQIDCLLLDNLGPGTPPEPAGTRDWGRSAGSGPLERIRRFTAPILGTR